jgi:hypothetical protein
MPMWKEGSAEELMKHATEYLVNADAVNMLVETGLGLLGIIGLYGKAGAKLGYVKDEVQGKAKELVDTLDQLGDSLRRQLEMVT